MAAPTSNFSPSSIASWQEVFIQDLAQMSHKLSEDPNNIDYNVLAEIVNEDETMQFLQDIIPRKITVRDFYKETGRKIPGESNES